MPPPARPDPGGPPADRAILFAQVSGFNDGSWQDLLTAPRIPRLPYIPMKPPYDYLTFSQGAGKRTEIGYCYNEETIGRKGGGFRWPIGF